MNTLDDSLEVPEHLNDVGDLAAFLDVHDIEWPRKPTGADLAAVKAVRGEVRELFAATTPAEAERRLNALLAVARTAMRVGRDRGVASIEWTVDTSVSLADAIRSAAAVSAAHLVSEFGYDRLRVCGADPCADVFLDVSKRGEQRFCGPRCATRVRVAAHRARQ